MKRNILLRTNLLVCLVIIVGFAITSTLSYQANFSASIQSIEQVSDLTSEGIYYQLNNAFSRPVNVSLTMANDSLLRELLSQEAARLGDEAYLETVQEYLDTYRQKYEYDSVFLVSAATGHYYNFSGLNRTLKPGDPENDWYFSFLEDTAEYSMNVDNDEAADNEITVFVNCKITDTDGTVLGVVGVGVRIDNLQQLLRTYEEEFGVSAYLIDRTGKIEISTQYTGYEHANFFDLFQYEEVKDEVLSCICEDAACSCWATDRTTQEGQSYLVSRYLPELDWLLLVVQNTGTLVQELHRQFYCTMLILAVIICIVLYVITRVIRSFNRQIIKLNEEQQEIFRHSTEQLYDNIYEFDLTHNCAAGLSTERYFESLGVPPDTSYDQAIQVIAEKQIHPDYQAGYLSTFSSQEVLRKYQAGNTHLRYDFLMRQGEEPYFWMRIDAHIHHLPEDDSIRMFTYRKNIDAEKRQELQMAELVEIDEMTGLYNKVTTERKIRQLLQEHRGQGYAFFIFDIDNFKQANDTCGHVFGDSVIVEFCRIIRELAGEEDILGRIGGDEFVAFFPLSSGEAEVEEEAQDLVKALDRVHWYGQQSWKMSTSLGIALAPRDGTDFETLYKHADQALYQTKEKGKNGFTLYRPTP